MRKRITLIIFALLLCSCTHWSKPGSTQQSFNQDMARCRMGLAGTPMPYQNFTNSAPGDVGGAMKGFGDAGFNAAMGEQYIRNCMISQGYIADN